MNRALIFGTNEYREAYRNLRLQRDEYRRELGYDMPEPTPIAENATTDLEARIFNLEKGQTVVNLLPVRYVERKQKTSKTIELPTV